MQFTELLEEILNCKKSKSCVYGLLIFMSMSVDFVLGYYNNFVGTPIEICVFLHILFSKIYKSHFSSSLKILGNFDCYFK